MPADVTGVPYSSHAPADVLTARPLHAHGRACIGCGEPAHEPADLTYVHVDRARRGMTETDDVSGLERQEIARRQTRFEQRGDRERNASEVRGQAGLFHRGGLTTGALPALGELFFERLDASGGKAEADGATH